MKSNKFTKLVRVSYQKEQPLVDVLQNICSSKFLNIHRKTLVLESHFNKVAGLKACNTCFPVNITKFLRTAFFIEHPSWLLRLHSQTAYFGSFYTYSGVGLHPVKQVIRLGIKKAL